VSELAYQHHATSWTTQIILLMVFVVPHHTHRAASRPLSLHQTDRSFSFLPLSLSQPPSAYPILDWVCLAKFQSATTPSRPSLSEILFLNFTLHRKISQPPVINPKTVSDICELGRKSRLWDLKTAEPASFPPTMSFNFPTPTLLNFEDLLRQTPYVLTLVKWHPNHEMKISISIYYSLNLSPCAGIGISPMNIPSTRPFR
jgi:hypothetical protein